MTQASAESDSKLLKATQVESIEATFEQDRVQGLKSEIEVNPELQDEDEYNYDTGLEDHKIDLDYLPFISLKGIFEYIPAQIVLSQIITNTKRARQILTTLARYQKKYYRFETREYFPLLNKKFRNLAENAGIECFARSCNTQIYLNPQAARSKIEEEIRSELTTKNGNDTGWEELVGARFALERCQTIHHRDLAIIEYLSQGVLLEEAKRIADFKLQYGNLPNVLIKRKMPPRKALEKSEEVVKDGYDPALIGRLLSKDEEASLSEVLRLIDCIRQISEEGELYITLKYSFRSVLSHRFKVKEIWQILEIITQQDEWISIDEAISILSLKTLLLRELKSSEVETLFVEFSLSDIELIIRESFKIYSIKRIIQFVRMLNDHEVNQDQKEIFFGLIAGTNSKKYGLAVGDALEIWGQYLARTDQNIIIEEVIVNWLDKEEKEGTKRRKYFKRNV